MMLRTSKGDDFDAISAVISDDGSEMTITIHDDIEMDTVSECFRDLKYIEADGKMVFGASYFFSCTHYIKEKQYKIKIERWA